MTPFCLIKLVILAGRRSSELSLTPSPSGTQQCDPLSVDQDDSDTSDPFDEDELEVPGEEGGIELERNLDQQAQSVWAEPCDPIQDGSVSELSRPRPFVPEVMDFSMTENIDISSQPTRKISGSTQTPLPTQSRDTVFRPISDQKEEEDDMFYPKLV